MTVPPAVVEGRILINQRMSWSTHFSFFSNIRSSPPPHSFTHMPNPASAPWDPGGGDYDSTTGGCGGSGRWLLSSAVPSPPMKTVRMRPTTRLNLPDSSDESEGGLMEAFRERQAKENQLGNVVAEAEEATANTMTDMTVGPPAVLPAGSPTTVGPPADTAVGFDKGIAMGSAVVGLDEGQAVGKTEDSSSVSSSSSDDDDKEIGREYQRLRLEKIARNEARLAELGLYNIPKKKKTKKLILRKTRTPPTKMLRFLFKSEILTPNRKSFRSRPL